jgi:uncharacterized protein YcfL
LFPYGNNNYYKEKKMKKAFLILLTFSLIMMVGCASAPARPANAPDWINEMPPEDVIWGIGIARQSSPAMSMTTAEARARVAIARQLNTRVQAMFTDYNLDAGNVGSQASTSMQEDVSRQVTNIDVSGARPIRRWQAPDGETWWFLVEYRKSDARNAMASILNNQEAQFAQFRAQQALNMLDAQLAKTEAPMRVDN